ncbi:exodeoxyribonuclease VII large subunit [bacterium]|nr:exodeoxyribonuclease VII large subunit [bacterium]
MNVADQVYGVGELTRLIKRTLEGSFDSLWLRGELTDVVHHRSGHLYFSLKDADAKLRGVMWRTRVQRLDFRPENGTEVLVFGRIVVYEKTGVYQLDCEVMQPAGMGALALEFEKLKARLAAEGLFDQGRKKPVPKTPRHIGVVTSESGAAVRDVLVTLARRGFDIKVTLAPARVQGQGASEDVARAIHELETLPDTPDLIIVARGGGSLEDLWAFNEEPAVRAVADCPIPIISGVGHETDTTLIDFVSDLRAPTPTGAAEQATPDRLDLLRHVDNMGHRLGRGARLTVEALGQRIERAAGGYGLRRLPDNLLQLSQQVDDLEARAERSLLTGMQRTQDRFERYSDRLAALSPTAVLSRGYAVIKSGSWVIKDASDLVEGQVLDLMLARGEASARVEEVRPQKPGK